MAEVADFPLIHLDPNHATRLAYVVHTAGDAARVNSAIDQIARREVEVFEHLQRHYDPLSREGIFISNLSGIIIGLAQDISRRKREYLLEIAAADSEYEVLHERFLRSTKWSIVVRATVAIAKVIFLGAVGIMISRMLEPYVPVAIAHQTGHRTPSELITFLTLVVGGWVGYKTNEFSRQSVETTRNWSKQEARLKYDRGRLEAFRQNWGELVLAWESYSGVAYEKAAFFELVIEGDFRADVEYIQMLRLQQRSMIVVLIDTLRKTATTCIAAIHRRDSLAKAAR